MNTTMTINGIKIRSSVQPKKRLEFNDWAREYRVSSFYQPQPISDAQRMIMKNSVKGNVGVYTGLKWLDTLLF